MSLLFVILVLRLVNCQQWTQMLMNDQNKQTLITAIYDQIADLPIRSLRIEQVLQKDTFNPEWKQYQVIGSSPAVQHSLISFKVIQKKQNYNKFQQEFFAIVPTYVSAPPTYNVVEQVQVDQRVQVKQPAIKQQISISNPIYSDHFLQQFISRFKFYIYQLLIYLIIQIYNWNIVHVYNFNIIRNRQIQKNVNFEKMNGIVHKTDRKIVDEVISKVQYKNKKLKFNKVLLDTCYEMQNRQNVVVLMMDFFEPTGIQHIIRAELLEKPGDQLLFNKFDDLTAEEIMHHMFNEDMDKYPEMKTVLGSLQKEVKKQLDSPYNLKFEEVEGLQCSKDQTICQTIVKYKVGQDGHYERVGVVFGNDGKSQELIDIEILPDKSIEQI